MKAKIISEIRKKIREANDIFLVSHERPDGDAIGSLLGMGLAIQKLGKNVRMLNPDPVPKVYEFLRGSDKIERLDSVLGEQADICIFLDSANPDRMGDGIKVRDLGGFVINVDHHLDNKRYGDLNLIDPKASATGELVYEILSGWEETELISPEVADALYTAILTDSGRFSYDSTSPRTHLIVADLLSKGANKREITRRIYEMKPFSALKLIGEMLTRAQLCMDGKVIWSFLPFSSFRLHGVSLVDSEGFLQFLRMAEGVKIVVLFRELEDGRIRVSLRSTDGNVGVREIAAKFGGGGHEKAAGCVISAHFEKARDLVLESIREKYGWSG
ncbi:MAG: bifunctional oligoribonuclease/PAP phosphatase NrnA [Synergistetes bacterium]|nr:bifunctional oligoribonuclease/PAP phosphatase NrnA [Synergistota bacterium]